MKTNNYCSPDMEIIFLPASDIVRTSFNDDSYIGGSEDELPVIPLFD